MVAERPRKKGKRDLTCTPSKSKHSAVIGVQLCSTGAFFDLIEWLTFFFLDFYLYLIL